MPKGPCPSLRRQHTAPDPSVLIIGPGVHPCPQSVTGLVGTYEKRRKPAGFRFAGLARAWYVHCSVRSVAGIGIAGEVLLETEIPEGETLL